MPRVAGKVPGYCRHKASGQAVVRIDGRDHYLGPYGSPASHAKYERLVAEWRAGRQELSKQRHLAVADGKFGLTLSEVLHNYREFAQGYYAKEGKPTKEFIEMKYALRPLRQLYGDALARDFGPLGLIAVRQRMIDQGLSRGVVNHRVNRIRRFFKWAVSQELVPASVHVALQSVDGLKYNRTTARETEPVRPVPDATVEATLPYCSPQIAAMIQVQRLTGMRPGEVVLLRECDIDMSDDIWIYEPAAHKNTWRGRRRIVPIGPKAQEVIKPFLMADPRAFLFSPRDADAWRRAQRRAARKTPMTPSQAERRPKRGPSRAKRERFDVDSYRRSIDYAIRMANSQRSPGSRIAHWFPLQLRHSRGTEVRKGFGIEAAQVSLGHAHASITEVYAERDLELAVQIARSTG